MALVSDRVKVGDTAPGFCLPDGLTGEEVCLEDFRGRALVLVILKGSW